MHCTTSLCQFCGPVIEKKASPPPRPRGTSCPPRIGERLRGRPPTSRQSSKAGDKRRKRLNSCPAALPSALPPSLAQDRRSVEDLLNLPLEELTGREYRRQLSQEEPVLEDLPDIEEELKELEKPEAEKWENIDLEPSMEGTEDEEGDGYLIDEGDVGRFAVGLAAQNGGRLRTEGWLFGFRGFGF